MTVGDFLHMHFGGLTAMWIMAMASLRPHRAKSTYGSCLHCGHHPVRQRYCSDACRKAAWKARRKAKANA